MEDVAQQDDLQRTFWICILTKSTSSTWRLRIHFVRTISQKSSFIITPGTWLLLFVGVLTTIGCYQTTLLLTQANIHLQKTYLITYNMWPHQKNVILDTSVIKTDMRAINSHPILRFVTSVNNYITSKPTGRRTKIIDFGQKACAGNQVI